MINVEFFISAVLVPVVTAIITLFISIYFNENFKKEKIIIIYNKVKENDKNIVLGSYNKNIEFENEFKRYLNSKNYCFSSYIKNLLHKSYINFSNKIYMKNKITFSNEENEISNMINYFKDDFDFIFHIKRYEAYIMNSNWNFKLVNIGKRNIYNLKVNIRNSLNDYAKLEKNILNINEYFEIFINYFDCSIRINSFDFGLSIPFEFGYSKYIMPCFYIVKKIWYNKKDEIVCDISYLTSNRKQYQYYICCKENKNNT